jgi:hypothetical protein
MNIRANFRPSAYPSLADGEKPQGAAARTAAGRSSRFNAPNRRGKYSAARSMRPARNELLSPFGATLTPAQAQLHWFW